MNNSVVVNNTYSPSTQTRDCKCKSSDLSSDFKNALAELMDSGNACISVKQTTVTTYAGTDINGEGLMLPSQENLMVLTSQLYEHLDALFEKHGIAKDPPVKISYSYTKTEVQITGDREDVEEIQRLINEEPDLISQVQTVTAMASHVFAIAESLAFQEDYRSSSDPEAAVNRHSHLFNDSRAYDEHTLVYGKGYSDQVAQLAADAEQAEIDELFDKIHYMLLMLYVQNDEDEDEEEQKVDSETGVAKDGDVMEQDDPRYQYMSLMQQIERTKKEALEKNGTDGNKYYFAVESYSMKMKRIEMGQTDKLNSNGSVEHIDDSEDLSDGKKYQV